MTYTVSSGTLNSTIPYHTIPPLLYILHLVRCRCCREPAVSKALKESRTSTCKGSLVDMGRLFILNCAFWDSRNRPVLSLSSVKWSNPVVLRSWYIERRTCTHTYTHWINGHFPGKLWLAGCPLEVIGFGAKFYAPCSPPLWPNGYNSTCFDSGRTDIKILVRQFVWRRYVMGLISWQTWHDIAYLCWKCR